eukprot:CAMPEP_0204073880 /NCGR_PEP_ID=MMETSP0360-20130528/163959_1 /ASSEMBLY_ACC=CAM_ASM_000342 /TAXON_ID=268821 /ORGANISM="Scrippsiella Hangoei, Strain SHTV-5" /LENGTH=129 /DNA_ID=CAMNT_0051022309 /DNA_START=21 /DNA_END=411 /DNA_ORIENTATION=-
MDLARQRHGPHAVPIATAAAIGRDRAPARQVDDVVGASRCGRDAQGELRTARGLREGYLESCAANGEIGAADMLGTTQHGEPHDACLPSWHLAKSASEATSEGAEEKVPVSSSSAHLVIACFSFRSNIV